MRMRRRRRLAAAQLALLLLAAGGDVASGRRKKAKPRAAEPPAKTTPAPATHKLPFAELPPLRAQPPSADGPLPELGLPPDFLSTAWDKSARLIRLGPSAFEGMMDLSRGDLDTLIESNALKMGEDAQFSKDGAKGSGNSPTLTVREAHWRLDDGASVLVSALEKFWPPAMPLVRPWALCPTATEPEPLASPTQPDRSLRRRCWRRSVRFASTPRSTCTSRLPPPEGSTCISTTRTSSSSRSTARSDGGCGSRTRRSASSSCRCGATSGHCPYAASLPAPARSTPPTALGRACLLDLPHPEGRLLCPSERFPSST